MFVTKMQKTESKQLFNSVLWWCYRTTLSTISEDTEQEKEEVDEVEV